MTIERYKQKTEVGNKSTYLDILTRLYCFACGVITFCDWKFGRKDILIPEFV